MCLAAPLRIIELHGSDAVGERDGIRRDIRVDFLPHPQVGDYVIVHAGFAIETLDAEQAEADLAAYRELADALATL